MGLVVTVQPAVEPLEADDVRTHIRDDFAAEAYVNSLIVAARQYCETVTARAFITQTLRLTLDAFPCGSFGGWSALASRRYSVIELPRPSLQSVTSITYVDSNGVTQTMSTSDYAVDTDAFPGRIVLGYGKYWPTARCQPNAVTITYVAGYGNTAASVPDTIKSAMRLLIGDMNENREAKIAGVIAENQTVAALLATERMVVVA